MASQNESNEKSRNDEIERDVKKAGSTDSGSADLESKQQQIEPFSDDDPHSASRITEIRSETAALLNEVSIEDIGYESVTPEQFRNIQKDVVDRS